jgi:hypothetical protein
LHNEGFSTPSNVAAIKSRRIRWAANVPQTGAERDSYKVLIKKNMQERDRLEDLLIQGRIVLKWIINM